MNWFGGGFVPIIIYGTGGSAATDNGALLTESGLDIETENGQLILVES
jgi:hypothetical protein